MFCHKAPLTDVAIDRSGQYMATAGLDGLMKVWDLRQYRLLHAYKPDRPVVSLDVSDTGLLAMVRHQQLLIVPNHENSTVLYAVINRTTP